jgi:hypothetical protein
MHTCLHSMHPEKYRALNFSCTKARRASSSASSADATLLTFVCVCVCVCVCACVRACARTRARKLVFAGVSVRQVARDKRGKQPADDALGSRA